MTTATKDYSIVLHPYHFFNGKYIVTSGGRKFEMSLQEARDTIEFVDEETAAGREVPVDTIPRYIAATMLRRWME